MAQPTLAQLARARALLARAEARFAGAEAVVRRDTPNGGEFDNNFDGVVSGIFHIVDAFELATTGLGREMREADQATRIASVVTALRAHETRSGSAPCRQVRGTKAPSHPVQERACSRGSILTRGPQAV